MSEPFDSPIEHAAAETVLPLPGSALRAAREANGYSLAEIAQVLKFSVRQLKGTTFIRGFVRSYARYLRLDEVPLLAALEPQVPVVIAEVRPVENMGAEMPVSGADGSKRVYGLAIAVLLLGCIAWFVWQERSVPASAPASQAAAPVVTGAATDEGAASPALAPEPTKSAESAPAVTPPSPSIIPADAAPATNAPAAGEADAASTAANPNERQLLLAFSGVSWVEVRDASNRILYSGNSTPDSRQTVRGRPPFQLVIGNAQSVKLRYEDRTIDLQPYTRVDVARLTLDDNTK
jgi:cytoskeleton protein RodZ